MEQDSKEDGFVKVHNDFVRNLQAYSAHSLYEARSLELKRIVQELGYELEEGPVSYVIKKQDLVLLVMTYYFIGEFRTHPLHPEAFGELVRNALRRVEEYHEQKHL
jgi:hypothetical protein